MALQPGTVIDRYVLEGVLGEGGMAIVYRARHRELDSMHAIKQLKVDDETIRDRLVQEGRLQSSLRHPNVVSVTDMVTIDDSPALVMEYVDGPNLSELLARHRPTLKQCDAIARGILKGAAAAHEHGMVHRDLKPANILIANPGTDIIPKIADFGLAKLLESLDDNDGLTKEGMIMGTPSYMAPEQVSDSRDVDGRADVFSLGVILYELVCGRRCFDGESAIKTWMAISKGEFVAPKSVFPGMPERMARAIEGALIVDRDKRISGAGELLDVWCSEDDPSDVPIVIEALSETRIQDTAEDLKSAAETPLNVRSDLAFDYTQDSYDVPSMIRQDSAPSAGRVSTKKKIFISYRRVDNAELTYRLYRALCEEHGEQEVFFDQQSIKRGHNYELEMINEARSTEVMLVMIGANWEAPRLHSHDDPIRRELSAALESGASILPILMGSGAEIPEPHTIPAPLRSITKMNAARLGTTVNFERDLPGILADIDALLKSRALGPETEPSPVSDTLQASSKSNWLPWGFAFAAVCGLLLFAVNGQRGPSETPSSPHLMSGEITIRGATKSPATSPTPEDSLKDVRAALLNAEFTEAERLLLELVKTRPKDGAVYGGLSLMYFFRGRPASAAATSGEGARLSGDSTDLSAVTARLADRSLRAAEKRDAVLASWETLREAHPKDAFLELTYLVSTRLLHDPSAFSTLIDGAQARFPKSPSFTSLRLKTLASSGQDAEWLKASTLAHLRFPGTSSVHLERARAEVRLGRLKEAEGRLKGIIDQDPNLTEARTALAEIYARRGNEASRMSQMMMSLSDAVPVPTQLDFLSHHGVAQASIGRLAEANKLWVFCLNQAQTAGHPTEALGCVQSAFEAHLWLAPVEEWAVWARRMESLLADPSVDGDVRQLYSLGLMWFRGVGAVREGDLQKARATLARVTAIKGQGAGFGAALTYEPALKFEIAMRAKDTDEAGSALTELEAVNGIKGKPPTCRLRIRRAELAQALGQPDAAATEFTQIIARSCRALSGEAYLIAESRLKLAGIRVGQGKLDEAADLLKAFRGAWPKADGGLVLLKRADALAKLMEQ